MTGPIAPQIDPKCIALGVEVLPPAETNRLHWELSHLWITENGCWDNVPDWARQFQSDHLGGDRHVYMLGLRLDGSKAEDPDLFILGWPEGFSKFSPKVEHEWWGNVPINAGFDWNAGKMGPYYAQVNAIGSSMVMGIGLPYPPYPWGTAAPMMAKTVPWDGQTYVGPLVAAIDEDVPMTRGGLHTSWFLVMQEVEAYEPNGNGNGNGNGPTPPPDQFQRCLDKAETCADRLADNDQCVEASQVYLNIAASLLISSGGCQCQ